MLWTLCTCEWLSLNNLDVDFMAQLRIQHCRHILRVKVFLTKTGAKLIVCCLIMFAYTAVLFWIILALFTRFSLIFRGTSQNKHSYESEPDRVKSYCAYTENLS